MMEVRGKEGGFTTLVSLPEYAGSGSLVSFLKLDALVTTTGWCYMCVSRSRYEIIRFRFRCSRMWGPCNFKKFILVPKLTNL